MSKVLLSVLSLRGYAMTVVWALLSVIAAIVVLPVALILGVCWLISLPWDKETRELVEWQPPK